MIEKKTDLRAPSVLGNVGEFGDQEVNLILSRVCISLTIDAFGLIAKAGTDTIYISYTFDDTFQSSFFTSISANQIQFRDTKEILSVLYK